MRKSRWQFDAQWRPMEGAATRRAPLAARIVSLDRALSNLVVRPKRRVHSVSEKRTTNSLSLWCDLSDGWAPSVEIAPLEIGALNTLAKRLSADAAAGGSPLISEISASLARYVDGLGPAQNVDAGVLRAHRNALRSVIDNGVTGDGGRLGGEIVRGLDVLVRTVMA